MKQYALLLAAAMLATPSHAAMDWSSLWRNADQRGEQLLQKGDAATAARTFSDPRRKAYAEAQAGNHETAARDYSAFDDADSHYNRGNALARSGKLEEALKAYDAALERHPGDPDAKHNRDLVAQALQQQKRQEQQQPRNQKNDNDGDGKDQQGGNDGKGGSKPQQSSKPGSDGGKEGKPDQGQSPQDQQDQHGANGESQKPAEGLSHDGGQRRDQGASGQQESQRESGNQAPAAQAPSAGQDDKGQSKQQQAGAPSQAQATQGDDKQQARQDAAAGLKEADRNGQRNPANAASALQEGGKPGGDPMRAGPVSEQKLAEDQWLRRIPDDPGGLLRRKFMIEHMLKQQQDPQNNPP